MISKWIPFGILEWAGFKLYEEMFDLTTAHHFEIFDGLETSLHVAFLENRGKDKYRFNYYFGTFEGKPISLGIQTQRQLDELRNDLIAIKKPENKTKAKDLNNKLLAVLFEKGYEKTIKNYYTKCGEF